MDADFASESWRPVVGYEGLYEVSDHGRFRSVERVVKFSSRWGTSVDRRQPGQLLKMLRHTGGYWRVMFWRDGRAQQVLAHKAVLEAFVGPRPDGHQACHGNGNRQDNRLSNLRWGTAKENQADRHAHGTRCGRAPGKRLTAEQVERIRSMAANDNISQVAQQLGLARTTVADVVNRRTWK